jgi:hypothetical protein
VNKKTELHRRDLERLSAYLDGELNPKDATHLEARLKIEPHLREALQDLDRTRKLVGSLPQVRPPRNFTLTPEMVGIRKRHNLFPVFRFATVVATVAFAVLVGADTFFRSTKGLMSVPEALVEAPAAMDELQVAEPAEKAIEEMHVEEEGEVEMLEAGDALGSEAPSAFEVDETEVYRSQVEEPSATDDLTNELTGAPTDTIIPLEEPFPTIAPQAAEVWSPTETQPMMPSPPLTPSPTMEEQIQPPQPSIEPIRAAEVGLAVVALILGVVTIILRKQR